MTAKETLWSVILIVVMIVAVYFGTIADNKCYYRSMEIYDIREESAEYDSEIQRIDNCVPNTEAKINSLNSRIETENEKVREKQKELSYEAYSRFVDKTGSNKTYEDYCRFINLTFANDVCKINELIAKRDELQNELEEYAERKIAEIPKLKKEREEFNKTNARQINENVAANKNEYYYMQMFCVSIMIMCFLILMKICTPFRYVVYSILAVATVNHISNKFKDK